MLLSADDWGARVSLVPDGALLLAGDRIDLRVSVGADARLELVEPAGTVAYSGGSSGWSVSINLAPRSTLIWAGEPFVVAEGASVERSTSIRLGWDARLALREVLVLGRYGERPGTLAQRLDVVAGNGVPILAEELSIGPESGRLWLGGRRVIGSVMTLGARLDEPVSEATVLQLEAAGSVVRVLTDDAHRAARSWDYAVDAICSRTLNSRSSAAAM